MGRRLVQTTPPRDAVTLRLRPALDRRRRTLYVAGMTLLMNIGDRARLRERFHGATHTVLARL